MIDNDGRAQPAPFREFWLVRPAAGGRQLRLYALADAPALAAAFQIDLVPGAAGRADVQVALYPREGAGKLLLAPLAGSFVQGEHRPGRVLPLQAEVHSVDGLAIHTAAGGWLWRPLDNPAQRSAYSFLVNTPRGFGLLQRDRDAGHYEPDAPQPRQPDLWLVPGADWGAGQLRLLEAPAGSADVRNVLVGFVPDQQPAPGAGMELGYAVQWSTDTSLPRAGGWVIATRSGAGGAMAAAAMRWISSARPCRGCRPGRRRWRSSTSAGARACNTNEWWPTRIRAAGVCCSSSTVTPTPRCNCAPICSTPTSL